jgi:hypothetical protein
MERNKSWRIFRGIAFVLYSIRRTIRVKKNWRGIPVLPFSVTSRATPVLRRILGQNRVFGISFALKGTVSRMK